VGSRPVGTRELPPSVDAFLQDGCGRCDRYRTPTCKVHRWVPILRALRALVLEAGLTETVKWGSPCYTANGRNVVMLAVFADRCALSFLEGAALADPDAVLEAPGAESRFVRFLTVRSEEDVPRHAHRIRGWLAETSRRAADGAVFIPAPVDESVPKELAVRLAGSEPLRQAFAALTPGRRRSHLLHIRGAKQAATRERRVEGCIAEILAGRGFRER